jgi:tRNA-specific 2-thiouridylase
MSERVLVAMSGGVDSSVAAARLVAAGCDVVGVTLHLWDYPDDGQIRGRCCAPEDVHDARRVADTLGFSHYAFDRRELFRRVVVDPFVDAYIEGVTPSPCVSCNRGVKMRELMALAERLEASAVATGHYARVLEVDGVPRLHRARDTRKDQSYFLHMLPPTVVERLRFPLGEMTKEQVRAEALRLRLPGAAKGESQELCFVPSGRYDAFVVERAGSRTRPGPIVDEHGHEVGRHRGIHAFTIGQRRNLGVSLGRRAYVVGIDPVSATVRVGEKTELFTTSACVEDVVLSSDVSLPLRCEVQVRYRAEPVPAELVARGAGRLAIRFDRAVAAVVPGQYAVFYRGDRVLGGGRLVESALERAAASSQPLEAL